jgi:hypothetical protein
LTAGPNLAKYDALCAVSHQLLTYPIAAAVAPRKAGNWPRWSSATQPATTASMTKSAVSSLRALRCQKVTMARRPVADCWASSKSVIR